MMKQGKKNPFKERRESTQKQESKEEYDQDRITFLEKCCLTEQGDREQMRTDMQFMLTMC